VSVRRLHLLRHAKSSWDDPPLNDHERPLAPRGVRAGKRLRRFLGSHELHPTLVLCSPATRARQTLELVLPALGSPDVAAEPRLYLASAAELLALVRELPDGIAEAMLVGHNPGLHELALALADEAGRPALAENLPTGALVTLDLPVTSWADATAGTAALASFVRPRDLP
jgi:phosphohistidine phosphatase